MISLLSPKEIICIPGITSFFSVVLGRVNIQIKSRLIELWVQGGGPQNIIFSKII